jgi:hypothetical protein
VIKVFYVKNHTLSRGEFLQEILSKNVNLSSNFISQNAIGFHLNPTSLCSSNENKSLLFISFVIIAPELFEKRNLIRATWANQARFSQDLKVIFVVGMSKNDDVNERIKQEFFTHLDIVQMKFNDSYYTITKKVMFSFKWIHTYCPNAKYALRINDDVFVNTFALIKLFKNAIELKSRQIYGFLVKNFTAQVSRRNNDKFYVSRKDYALDHYPDYPSGKLRKNII